MARPLRIEYPGAVYHVTSRGNARIDIYADDSDRQLFLAILAQVVKRFNWLCHAYCLMGNHYHLLIETPEGNLSAGMRQLNGVYTQAYNRKHRQDGHLFKGRYKAILVEKEAHLLELCRYIVLNPVRAAIVERPDEYVWSSYLPTLGKCTIPPCLSTEWLLANFSSQLSEARARYRSFVLDGIAQVSVPWERLCGQIILGAEAFAGQIRERFCPQQTIAEIPRQQRLAGRPTLLELFSSQETGSKSERNRTIAIAVDRYGYSLSEIGHALGIHYTTVSKVLKAEK